MSGRAEARTGLVPLDLLRRYLVAAGWKARAGGESGATAPRSEGEQAVFDAFMRDRPVGRRSYDLFVLPGEGFGDIEIVVPRERTGSDLVQRSEAAIRTLADVEGRPPDELAADVRSIGFDVVRSRIPDTLVRDDTIELEVAANYVNGVRTLLAATATTELEPQPFFLRLKKEAVEYADRCRFGHTFRGSFGFTVESPLVANVEPVLPGMDQPVPFERRVVARLARGVSAVCQAAVEDSTELLVERAGRAFGANALDQFAALVETTSAGGLEFAFTFSREWDVPADLRQASNLRVSAVHADVARAAAKMLRTSFLPRQASVFGRVVRLETDADPSDLLNPIGAREIAIQWSSEELGDIQVRVFLGPEDYLLALEAHGAGKPVLMSGTLERRGRPWVLSSPTRLSVP